MILLITGRPGIGKTTLIKKVIKRSSLRWGGFYTQEIRVKNNRVGFKIISLSGEKGVLAHKDIKSKYKVGKYYINIHDLEVIAARSVNTALIERKPVVIDEIGKMEIMSDKFKNAVNMAFQISPLVMATISQHETSYINSIKRIENAILIEVTHENRDLLNKMILDLIKKVN